MSLEPILALIVVAVIANLVVMGLLVASPAIGRMRDGDQADERGDPTSDPAMAAAAVVGRGDEKRTLDESDTIRTYDRVVRIASWVFLLAVTTIVGVTGLWPQSQTAIFLLLALGGVFVLVIHDLLPASALGPAKFVLEGTDADTAGELLDAVTAGRSGLRYDASADRYTYVWKTDKAWAKKTGQFVLTLSDGTTHTFDVSFKK